jgi:hypothetical protein
MRALVFLRRLNTYNFTNRARPRESKSAFANSAGEARLMFIPLAAPLADLGLGVLGWSGPRLFIEGREPLRKYRDDRRRRAKSPP